MAMKKAFAACFLAQATVEAYRVKPKKREVVSKEGEDGQVSLLYTYGCPSVAKPHMRNPRRADGCFPGRRFWASNHDASLFGNDEVDIVPPLPNIVGYRHPTMEGVDLDVGTGTQQVSRCSEQENAGPPGVIRSYLHAAATYSTEASKLDRVAKYVSQVGLDVSYKRNETEAAMHVSRLGWGLVHTAFHDGGLVGGPQASHLVQHPQTLECIVTFQGTDSTADWLADAQAISLPFCGLESEVHRGFRNHLRRIVKSSVFQERILPYLGSCSKVIATGHSLGGAMATLFTACMAQAPARGTKGWNDDYQYMWWKQQRASRLPYIKPSP